MSSLLKIENQDTSVIEKVIIDGDLKGLTAPERISYYNQYCRALGLDPVKRPFDYMFLNGKLVLYANKGCAEQLRSIHKVSINITSRQLVEGVYLVTSRAKNAEGREDESIGAVDVTGLKGLNLANAMMKAETKSKRRVTLSICGANTLDEYEVDSIKDARKVPFEEATSNEVKNSREELNSPPSQEPLKSQQKPPRNETPVSQAQLQRMFAIMNTAMIKSDELKEVLKELYGIESSKDIKLHQYDELCEALKKGRDDFFFWSVEKQAEKAMGEQ